MAQVWQVVGGCGPHPGIVVRAGMEMHSLLHPLLLSKGSKIKELGVVGDRLHFTKVEGEGPDQGWISISFCDKELVVPQKPPRPPPPDEVGINNEAPLPIALLFPGQGSQYLQMMDGVKDLPAVHEMIQRAQQILGYDILELCQKGPEEKLEATRYCQPAMFIGGLAGLEKLRKERPEAVSQASVMAGFSLGEYTALCAAGVFSFEDALRLVSLRGEAMHEAAERGGQRMLSVVGLDQEELEKLCKDARSKAGRRAVCQIAIHLFPGGFTVGGTEKAIKLLQVLAEKAGAAQVRMIKTSGAFHTPLMQPALDKLSVLLEEALPNMKTPRHSVWMNVSAEPLRPGCAPKEIVALLKRQLTKPVLWEESMLEMIKEDRISEFYELGPSKQLKAMMKRIDATVWKSFENIEIGFKPRDPLPTHVGPKNASPLPVAILFAGQGSQYVGMMEGVKEMPAVKEMFAKAKKVLGYDLLQICEEGPEEKITETRHNQPAMFIGGLAGFERLKEENEEAATRAAVMAGFSLGEYTALCAAGVFSFDDGLKLVKVRGEAMQAAADDVRQGMLSVVGLKREKIEQLCKDATKKAGSTDSCKIAISLFSEGFTVGGTERAINCLKDLADKAGAKQVKILKASGAFHTPLIESALETLSVALEEVLPRMKPPRHLVYMNASAIAIRPGGDPQEIVTLLKKQLTNEVLWEESMREILADKVTDFFECGPSKQLKSMMKQIDADAWKNMENMEIGTHPRAPPPMVVGPHGEPPLPFVLLFPGQGSQYTGMLKEVDKLVSVPDMLEKARAILGWDVIEMCASDADRLSKTDVAQPILFIAGLVGLEKLRTDNPEALSRAAAMVGFSVGEYAALCAAGAFSFEDGLQLLKRRGELMMEVINARPQGMLSVIGLDRAKLEPLCKEAAKREGQGAVCEIALHLFPGGISVGGTLQALSLLEQSAVKAGAQQAKIIGNAGFHTSLLQPGMDKINALLDDFLPKMKSPVHSVWMNSTAEPVRPCCDPKHIIENLKKMHTKPVMWDTLLKEVIKEMKGKPKFYELGCSRQLKQMMKRVDNEAWKNTENYEV